MGNLCSKADNDPFSQPGRVLGSAPPPTPRTASLPPNHTSAKKQSTVGGPPRTLGGSSAQAADSPAAMARKAAEARAQATGPRPKGKIAQKLEANQNLTTNETLKAMSAERWRWNEADMATAARRHD